MVREPHYTVTDLRQNRLLFFKESWQTRYHSYLHKVMGVNRWAGTYSYCIGKETEALKRVRVF